MLLVTKARQGSATYNSLFPCWLRIHKWRKPELVAPNQVAASALVYKIIFVALFQVLGCPGGLRNADLLGVVEECRSATCFKNAPNSQETPNELSDDNHCIGNTRKCLQ